MNNAQPTLSSAAASTHEAASPSLELLEARQLRDALKQLLRKEQAAMADFLMALADFDRLRGWEPLGHASFFAFLHFEMGLSNSAAFYRMSASRLIQRIPELVEPMASGRLCLSTTAELAKVVTEENWTEVAPRFFGLSAREAREVVAELQSREAPPLRAVVTLLAPPLLTLGSPQETPKSTPLARSACPPDQSSCSPSPASFDTDPESLLTSEEELTHPTRGLSPRDDTEPLTAELRRLHVTVSRPFLKKLEAARDGLSHAIPGATMEQVLEAALDLLLEKQAKARGQVKRPRTTLATAAPREARLAIEVMAPRLENPTLTEGQQFPAANCSVARPEGRAIRREGPREPIPAAVRRAVWERDGQHCTWPLDGGGYCGSSYRLELDHIIPWAEWGPSTVENLRLVCGRHNALAARRTFGSRCADRYGGANRGRGRSRGGEPPEHPHH
jgi:hypothetical protein